jgi:serine/threonine-protein kinase
MNPAHIDEVTDAILDGTDIDWSRVESAGEAFDVELDAQLKTLAGVKFLGRAAEAERSNAGFSWGHLQVFEPVGRGAYGEVFRAWDTRLDREVALKLMPDADPSDVSRTSVIEEGRLLARVRHPNVVTIHGAERISGRIGLWMEFIKGRTLEQLIRDGKQFGASEVAKIGLDLSRAVSAVHAAGLLHRDIKAQNVMVANDDGRLVLMDFGTGRELEAISESNVAGTPLYLAPEVLSGGAATARSDVYSIGVVMYRLLTGAYPVEARDLAELRRIHATRMRGDLRSARPDLPKRLARIVERACHPAADQRYDRAAFLAEALAELEGMPAPIRRAYATAAAVAVVAIGVIGWQLVASERIPRDPSPAVAATAVVPAPRAQVIAVLPFRNLSGEPGNDDFVDGLTSEIIRTIGAIKGLQVRSHTSSFTLKGTPRNLSFIAEKLDVDLIVEADVVRAGGGLRIDAQLVRVADDVALWSQRFDRLQGNVVEIQNEISRAIAGKLGLQVRPSQRPRRTLPEAYEIYLRARALVGRSGHENAQRAADLFEQVIARDPAFAPAYAGLADAYAKMSWQIEAGTRIPLRHDEALRLMRPAAMKALELDGELAEAHAAMGLTYAREHEWLKAQASFEKAIALDSTLTHIQSVYASAVLLPLGQSAEAVRLLRAALEADPLSLDLQRTLANAEIVAGHYDQAVRRLRGVLTVDPDYPHANLLLARALTFSDNLDEAQAIWRTRQGAGGEIWAAQTYMRAGRRDEVQRMVPTVDHPYRQAIVFAALGDKDRTFEALNRAVDVLPQRTALLLVYPEMEFLRGDARLDVIRKKLKLP